MARPQSAGEIMRTRVVRTLSSLEQDYRRGDWTGVLQSTGSMTLGHALVQTMKSWKSERVPRVTFSLVYGRRIDAHHYVATIHFYLDPRAMQEYSVYQFAVGKNGARIVGKTSGISGANYKQANWRVTRTAHFLFYHGPYQLMGSDRKAVSDLEYERAQFIRKFGVKLPAHAAYYVYPDTQLMDRMTKGSCGSIPENIGCTNPFATPPTIQAAAVWPSFHEPIHVYQLALAPPARPGSTYVNVAPRFISEGMAVALEDRELDPRLSDYCSDITYAPLDKCGRAAARHVKPLSLLTDDGFGNAPAGYAYALSGSFVKYLILRYGYRPFGTFYYRLAAQPTDHQSDYDVAALAVYHKPIAPLLDQFIHVLCARGC
jgi:hypothetical protein